MPVAYPNTKELTHIVRNRVSDTAGFIGRNLCPEVPVYAAEIEYDVLYPASGMTKAHQIGTDPKTIQRPKMETKRVGTAYWKEKGQINEEELLKLRKAGAYNERAGREAVTKLALGMDDRLSVRMEWLVWKMLVDGILDIDENGVKYTVDYKLPAKVDISGDAQKKWTAFATADPIDTLISLIQSYRGSGANPKTVYMNSVTAGWAVKSARFVDLLKQSNYAGLLSPLNADKTLKMLIPKVNFEIYDGIYADDANEIHMFIPDGEIVVYGDYPGEKVMDFGSTISLHKGSLDKPQPGRFSIVKDKSASEENPYIAVTTGIYGLPRMFHPTYIRRAKVG